MGRLRLLILTAALALFIPRASAAAHPLYRLDAASYFDPFAGETAWIQANVDVIMAYPPFGDRYVALGKPVIGYHDAATEGYAPLTPASRERYLQTVLEDRAHGYGGTYVASA